MSVPTMLVFPKISLSNLSLKMANNLYYQCSTEDLIAQTIQRGQGILNDTGALVIRTGEFTGRSPKDKFIVKDELTATSVNWNEFNTPIEAKYFDSYMQRGVSEEILASAPRV
jgi:phosphoenolpyruvate carboxykinase (ATP)